MTLDPRDGADLATPIVEGYAATEAELLREMASSLTVDVNADDWSTRQQGEQLRFRQRANRIVQPLQAGMPKAIAAAVTAAADLGAAQADDDLASLGTRGKELTPAVIEAAHRKTAKLAQSASRELFDVNTKIPGAVDDLYSKVRGRVELTASTAGTREQAVQQALDILTARGITGFRDNAGRNWSLATYIEMKSRTVVNQQLIDAHTDRMLARGQTLIIVSSHSNPAPVCQPFEGQVLSLNGDTGTILQPSKTGGPAVKVSIKATLKDARSKGFQHPNCAHAVSAFVPGATRTYETTPDPEGYAASQQQRAMERAIRATKQKLAVAVTSDAKKRLNATLRSQQASLRSHLAEHDLKRRPKRERPDLGYQVGKPGDGTGLSRVPDPTPPTPKPSTGATPDDVATRAWLEAEAKHNADVTAWLDAEKAFEAAQPLSKTTRDLIDQARASLPSGKAEWDAFQSVSKDANGAYVPSRRLRAHLRTVADVGEAVQGDVRRRLDADTDYVKLVAERAAAKVALDDAKRTGDWRDIVAANDREEKIGEKIAKKESATILDILSSVRPFGGHQQTVRTLTAQDKAKLSSLAGRQVRDVDADAVKLLREAERFYPKAWLEAADQRGPLSLGYVDRGFFLQKHASTLPHDSVTISPRGQYGYQLGAHADQATETMIHELGHRMEVSIPGLTQLEFALARERATHNNVLEQRVDMGGGEWSYKDDWGRAYTGRTYASETNTRPDLVAHEVFQTGTQDLYGRSLDRYAKPGDTALEEFMMGVLTLL